MDAEAFENISNGVRGTLLCNRHAAEKKAKEEAESKKRANEEAG